MYSRLLFLFGIGCWSCLVLSSEAEGHEQCQQLCNDYVSFVYKTVQMKSMIDGLLPMRIMYSFVKQEASGFCKNRVEAECKEFVDNTWMIAVATERGVSVGEICRHLPACKKRPRDKKTAEQAKAEFIHLFEKICAEFSGSKGKNGVFMKVCTEVKLAIQSWVWQKDTKKNGVGVMEQPTTCTNESAEIGCYVQKAPPVMQLAFATATSLIPSFSKLKESIWEMIPPPSVECQDYGLENLLPVGKDAPEDFTSFPQAPEFSQKRCQVGCDFMLNTFFPQYIKKYRSFLDFDDKLKAACVKVNATKPEVCGKIVEYIPKLKESLMGIFTDLVCSNATCNFKQGKGKKCDDIFEADNIRSSDGAIFRQEKNGSALLQAPFWCAIWVVFVAITW